MEIKVLAFGITHELLGKRSLILELEEGILISELKEILIEKYPKLSELKSLAVACNEEYAEDDQIVPANATVALIPPVSGG